MSKKTSWVQGATGIKRYRWTTKRQVNLGAQQVTHSFLVIPKCPAPLLKRDLLFKVNAQIHFDHGEISVLDGTGHPIQVLSLALRDEYRLYQPKPLMAIDPTVQPWVRKYPLPWAKTAGVRLAKCPISVKLKSDVTPIRVKQYPLSLEARQRIAPHIQWLLEAKILKRCRSPWNTPLLPIKKARGNGL